VLALLRPGVDALNGPAYDRRFGRAWLALTAVLAAHVLDEALTDFLSVYNPIVRAARARYPWFPMPTFTFGPWITGLAILVLLLVALAPLAYARNPIVRAASYPFGVIMLLNGIGHLAGSLYFGRWMPGATTAPFLIVTSIGLLAAARGRGQKGHEIRARP
jgi:hypothetical protein